MAREDPTNITKNTPPRFFMSRSFALSSLLLWADSGGSGGGGGKRRSYIINYYQTHLCKGQGKLKSKLFKGDPMSCAGIKLFVRLITSEGKGSLSC